jgi:hypothetical protein
LATRISLSQKIAVEFFEVAMRRVESHIGSREMSWGVIRNGHVVWGLWRRLMLGPRRLPDFVGQIEEIFLDFRCASWIIAQGILDEISDLANNFVPLISGVRKRLRVMLQGWNNFH